ncbi:MAG: sigma-70 family RNA polymerase sigma factor [Clostridia bacterium]|nr:sigma-70 family RNA polymerase sigma factor [Clostridia bacterium]
MREMDEVYKRYAKTVYRYLLTLTRDPDTAEELTQETFYQAIRSADRFDGSSSVSTWLCAIAKRVRLAHLRKHPPHEDIDSVTLPCGSAEEDLIKKEERMELMKKLHSVKEPAREVMYLRAFGGLSFREIGEILGKTENWARVTYFRGKESIRKETETNE